MLQSEPFQKPVDVTAVPNYKEFVVHPMDLSLIEKVCYVMLCGCIHLNWCTGVACSGCVALDVILILALTKRLYNMHSNNLNFEIR